VIGYLADGVVGGTALALLASVVCAFESVRSRPSLVFAIWLVVIARFAVPGLVPLDLPGGAVAVFAAPLETADPIAGAGAAADGGGLTWQTWLLLAWIAGASIAAGFALAGWVRLRRMIARMTAAPADVARRASAIAGQLGIARAIEVRVDPERGPFAAGVVHPVVVLPAWIGAGRELDHVLAHELAHHRRRDPLIAAAVRAVSVVFFFWPVMWYAVRRLAIARERATDQVAIGGCARDPRGYARALVRVTLAARTREHGAAAMAARSSDLRQRITDALGGARSGVGWRGWVGLAAMIALALPAARIASAEPAPEAIDCTITPGVGERIMATHPDADRDGDGTLSRDEICAHQRRMQQRLRDAAVRADVLVDTEPLWFSPAAVSEIAGAASIDVEIADAGGAVCTPAANRCVEEMVLIDVSAE
jgi:beta-lactamase regulating signal transducer with metallopeptidase domain